MEKIYRVQMNAKGMPNFTTAEEVVRCRECKHKTYCYGDVLWTNKRQTVDIHKDIDFCSFGEREGE